MPKFFGHSVLILHSSPVLLTRTTQASQNWLESCHFLLIFNKGKKNDTEQMSLQSDFRKG